MIKNHQNPVNYLTINFISYFQQILNSCLDWIKDGDLALKWSVLKCSAVAWSCILHLHILYIIADCKLVHRNVWILLTNYTKTHFIFQLQANSLPHKHKSEVQTQTVQAAFPFSNYILHLNASNAFSLQTAELINSHLLLLDSPRGGKKHNCPLLWFPDTHLLHRWLQVQTRQDVLHTCSFQAYRVSHVEWLMILFIVIALAFACLFILRESFFFNKCYSKMFSYLLLLFA